MSDDLDYLIDRGAILNIVAPFFKLEGVSIGRRGDKYTTRFYKQVDGLYLSFTINVEYRRIVDFRDNTVYLGYPVEDVSEEVAF